MTRSWPRAIICRAGHPRAVTKSAQAPVCVYAQAAAGPPPGVVHRMPERPEDTDPACPDEQPRPKGPGAGGAPRLRARTPLRRGPVDCDFGTRRALRPSEPSRRGPGCGRA
jgi:hypothetical protein